MAKVKQDLLIGVLKQLIERLKEVEEVSFSEGFGLYWSNSGDTILTIEEYRKIWPK